MNKISSNGKFKIIIPRLFSGGKYHTPKYTAKKSHKNAKIIEKNGTAIKIL